MPITFEGNLFFLDPSSVNKSLAKANQVALRDMALEIIYDTNDFVPMRTGMLRNSATIEKATRSGVVISYSRPIERGLDTPVSGDVAVNRLYKGLNAVRGTPVEKENWTTPGTGGNWFGRAEKEHGGNWIKHFTYTWMRQYTGQRL